MTPFLNIILPLYTTTVNLKVKQSTCDWSEDLQSWFKGIEKNVIYHLGTIAISYELPFSGA